eukprot:6173200-Pleurochrysis_carterae.AAC.4
MCAFGKSSTLALLSGRGVAKPFLKRKIKRSEEKITMGSMRAAQTEILLPTEPGVLEAEGMERTDRFSQEQVTPFGTEGRAVAHGGDWPNTVRAWRARSEDGSSHRVLEAKRHGHSRTAALGSSSDALGSSERVSES